ncbi:MAG: hypothetical protein EP297_05190 [Gammaproteobacteria bacterium]|nr:MAG: hypothetical protein EP297_05190 [Gammaproteobacteria bacterium]
MHNLIPILITAVAVATLLNVLLKQISIPTVIGYIFTGIILGAIFDIHVHGNKDLEHIAEFGVVFLMFTIGLEFSVSHLKSMKNEVFLFGLLQVTLTGAFLAMIAHFFFDIDAKAGIIIGAGLALSSTAIVLKILNETGQIKSDFGRKTLGILIFQDIAVIPILLMIALFTDQDKSLGQLLTETAINAVIALAILIVIGKYFVGYLLRAVSNANSKEIFMGSILFIVVGASYIAHHFGFSYSLGGFIAGMMIADTIYKYQVEADLIPFRDLLLGVFFVSVGLQIDMNVVQANILTVVLLGIGIMLAKALVIFSILIFSAGKKVALKTAITAAQIGEFSLVVFSLILANNMLDPISVQIVMVTIVLSMIATPVLINNSDKIVNLLTKGEFVEEPIELVDVIGGHVILCGYGAFGRAVSDHLDSVNINHVIVTNNTDDYVRGKTEEKTVVFGDPADRVLLDNLNIQKAINTVLALDDPDQIKQVSAAISLINPELKVIAKVSTEEEKKEYENFNHELLLDGNSHTASVLVDQIAKSRLLAEETAKLQYLQSYSIDTPSETIEQVQKEQVRLLDIMSSSFNALREERDIMHLKAFHESFKVLSEIIGNIINEIMTKASLPSSDYKRINTLMDNQHLLVNMNESLELLGKELKELEKNDETEQLSHMAVEGLDTVLLSLKDIAADYTEEDMLILKSITSDSGKGLSRIREAYLGEERDLAPELKALLLSATNHMDRLRRLFGSVGNNYMKLANA